MNRVACGLLNLRPANCLHVVAAGGYKAVEGGVDIERTGSPRERYSAFAVQLISGPEMSSLPISHCLHLSS